MEASHKANPQQWISIVTDKFRMSTNGGRPYTAEEIAEVGTYNVFLGDTEHYRSSEETFDSAEKIFHTAFPNGFLWEITEVLAGPPNVTFKWRHWGTLNGPFKDRAAIGSDPRATAAGDRTGNYLYPGQYHHAGAKRHRDAARLPGYLYLSSSRLYAGQFPDR